MSVVSHLITQQSSSHSTNNECSTGQKHIFPEHGDRVAGIHVVVHRKSNQYPYGRMWKSWYPHKDKVTDNI